MVYRKKMEKLSSGQPEQILKVVFSHQINEGQIKRGCLWYHNKYNNKFF